MKKYTNAISLVLIALIILIAYKLYETNKPKQLSNKPVFTTVAEALQDPKPVEVVTEPPKPVEPVVEPVKPVVCPDTQWVWAEDGLCHDKPVAKPAYTVTGDWVAQCHAWAAMAGISLPPAAINLIQRESECSPTVCNPNGIACGIAQALPWTKMGCALAHTDSAAICQLKWMQSYVFGRYGSWDAAWSFWLKNAWY